MCIIFNMSDMKNTTEQSLVQVNDILKLISENNEFKLLVEKVCSNLKNISDNEPNKKDTNEDNINLLNMYLLDENGNNLCDILNKINTNITSINHDTTFLVNYIKNIQNIHK